jgi:hypothetical protein
MDGYLKQNCDGTLTLMKNCVATAMTCVQASASTGCIAASPDISFAAGDTIAFRWENTPDPTCGISNGNAQALYTRP